MYKIAVCDDNVAFLQNAVHLIEKWSESAKIDVEILSFSNGNELIEKNLTQHFDIIILDIVMPALSGMDAAREIRLTDNSVSIIFLTSSPDFAVQSYDVEAFNYLLKPVSFEKLSAVLNKQLSVFEERESCILLKTSLGFRKVNINNIEYFEAQNKHVLVCLRNGENIDVVEPLHMLEQKLDSSNFFKCHRSYYINLRRIDSFDSAKIVTESGRIIPIARGYFKLFKEAYFSEMFSK